jgi:hypothetical protein
LSAHAARRHGIELHHAPDASGIEAIAILKDFFNV